eukprot:1196420-Prorocentrum_minimum.AAC.4
MLWVTDLGAREQEVHNTGDDSDEDAGVTLDLNGKEMIAAIDFKQYNEDGTPQVTNQTQEAWVYSHEEPITNALKRFQISH